MQKLANKVVVGEPLKEGGVRPLRSLYLRVVKLVRPEDEFPAPMRPIAPVLPPLFILVKALVPTTLWIIWPSLLIPGLMRS